MRKRTALIHLLVIQLSLLPSLHAQTPPSVAAFSLVAKNAPESTAKTANDVVFSFIKELRSYRVVDMRAEPLPLDLGVPDGMDYIFYGYLEGENGGMRLELVLKGGPWAVTRKISRVYDTTNRILLESRMLVRDLFDQSVALPDPEQQKDTGKEQTIPAATELIDVPSLDALAGSWKGESGIEKIMLLRGGRGIVVLESGVSLTLDLLISGGELVVRQKGLPQPRQFADLPDPVANQAAAIAPPIEWRFHITPDLATLSGTKKAVSFTHDGKNIISMENAEMAVRWDRDRR